MQVIGRVDYFEINAVSNSALGMFKLGPREFKRKMDAGIKEESESLTMGDAVHTLCFEADTFDERFIVADCKKVEGLMGAYIEELARLYSTNTDMPLEVYEKSAYEKAGFKIPIERVKADFLKPVNKDYFEFLCTTTEKQVLSIEDSSTIRRCVESLSKHKVAKELIFGYEKLRVFNELVIQWTFKGVECKSKIDRLIVDDVKKKVYLVDLKTTSKNVYLFKGSFEYYSYHRQMAFYKMAVKSWLMESLMSEAADYSIEVFMPVVQTTGSNETIVYKPSEKALEEGEVEFTKLISDLSWHYTHNDWDYPRSYYEGDGIVELDLRDGEDIINGSKEE